VDDVGGQSPPRRASSVTRPPEAAAHVMLSSYFRTGTGGTRRFRSGPLIESPSGGLIYWRSTPAIHQAAKKKVLCFRFELRARPPVAPGRRTLPAPSSTFEFCVGRRIAEIPFCALRQGAVACHRNRVPVRQKPTSTCPRWHHRSCEWRCFSV
jgi:hypothetical protein